MLPISPVVEATSSTLGTNQENKSSSSKSVSKRAYRRPSSALSWTNEEITSKEWLQIKATGESISMLLRYLSLGLVARTLSLEEAIRRQRRYLGLILIAERPIDLREEGLIEETLYIESKRNLYKTELIANSELTLSLLNMRIYTRAPDSPNTGLEDYIDFMFGEQRIAGREKDPNLYLQHVVPIAFAHNYVAKRFPLHTEHGRTSSGESKENNSTISCTQQCIYPFIAERSAHDGDLDELLLVTDSGELIPTAHSNIEEFCRRLRELNPENKIDAFAIVENEIEKLTHELEKKREELAKLSGKSPASTSLRFDNSLSCEELAEISAISEELDSAEDFSLIIQQPTETGVIFVEEQTKPKAKPTAENSESSKRGKELEEEVKLLAKRIVAAKEELQPYSWDWDKKSERELYVSQDYLNFSAHYRATEMSPKGNMQTVTRAAESRGKVYPPERNPQERRKNKKRKLGEARPKK